MTASLRRFFKQRYNFIRSLNFSMPYGSSSAFCRSSPEIPVCMQVPVYFQWILEHVTYMTLEPVANWFGCHNRASIDSLINIFLAFPD